jgi:thiosulfate/3-mercaptopyruvate sulfurtransferase
VNRPYSSSWENEESKDIKSYAQLQELYRGLDTAKATVTYCHSGRRASFSYFILRLMGFQEVMLFEGSWNEWGDPDRFFPVETVASTLPGGGLPQAAPGQAGQKRGRERQPASQTESKQPDSGYVSCGG